MSSLHNATGVPPLWGYIKFLYPHSLTRHENPKRGSLQGKKGVKSGKRGILDRNLRTFLFTEVIGWEIYRNWMFIIFEQRGFVDRGVGVERSVFVHLVVMFIPNRSIL